MNRPVAERAPEANRPALLELLRVLGFGQTPEIMLSNLSGGPAERFSFVHQAGRMVNRVPEARSHLWQLDVVRLITFGGVIAVHSIGATQPSTNVVAGGALMLLQFGREVFFALSAFVLAYSGRSRPLRPWAFWRRRVPLVLVPYLAWTLIYWFTTPGGTPSVSTLGRQILDGSAEYHLYFLVVTIQLYLVFPLLLRFVRRTANRAIPVLVVVGVSNMLWLAAIQYFPNSNFFWVRSYELLPTYAIYVLAGCYAAIHYERLHELVMRNSRRLVMVAAAAVLIAEGAYAWQLRTMEPRTANAVLQPATTAVCLAALIVLYLSGARWASGSRRAESVVKLASEISFGVYLAHPFFLQLLVDIGLGTGNQVVPAPLATVLAFLGAGLGAAALSLAVRKTPLARVLIGRPRAVSTPVKPSTSTEPLIAISGGNHEALISAR